MSDGRQLGEAVLVIVAVGAVLLSAAFLPLVDVFGDGGGLGEFGAGGGGLGGGLDSGSGSELTGELGGSGGGSPLGGSLTEPPEETGIGGGRESGEPLPSVPLFVVESPENTYWRQTAYTRYTGTGWERSTSDQPVAEGVPNDDRTVDGRSIEYEVTVLSDTRSLPTAWQPETVRVPNQSGITVRASTVGGVTTDRPLPEGSTYTAESSPPPRDPATLRRADGRAPTDLQETYTQLPSETPDRVEEFSRELTAAEDTRYDRVVAVHDWLESNKGYSLQTPIDPSQPIADQLIFEVDAAYCQHFATTMAVMLRSQDIPARYVVGFAEGSSVGDDEYLVTSDRAHAWVEVYFEGVGWVRFDPTPGGELPVESPQPPYNISLNRSAVVGAPVAVSVDKDETGVVGVPVYVNDERVGWTDANGEVSTRLPYVEDITITARPSGSETKYTDDGGSNTAIARIVESVSNTVTARIVDSLSAVASSLPMSLYRVGTPAVDALGSAVFQTGTPSDESSKTYTAEANATVSVVGNRTVGGTARVAAAVRDVAVTGGTVTLDGTQVGTTNSDGYYDLSLQGVEVGQHRVTVSRGPVTAETTFTVRPPDSDSDPEQPVEADPLAPNISVSSTPIALPGWSATATVSRNGRPIADTPVRVDGRVVGETDANGTLEFSFPVTDAVVVAATKNGVTGEQPVDGLYRNAIGLVVAVVGTVGGLGVLARRYGIGLRLLARKLAAAGSVLLGLPHRLTALVIRLATGFEAAVQRLWRRLRSLPSVFSASLVDLLGRLSPRGLLVAVAAWLRSRLRDLRRTDGDSEAAAEAAAADLTEDQRRIRAIWGAFVGVVRPPKLTTRTPGEIGRYAIERGLPQRPVEFLTDLYRAVEYGRRSPGDSRLETARNALSTIREQEDDE